MRLLKTIVFTLGCVGFESACNSYDSQTHALITEKAFSQSVLTQTGANSVRARLGFDRLDSQTPFNAYWLNSGTAYPAGYYDNTTPTNPANYLRRPNGYESCQMQQFRYLNTAYSNDFANIVDVPPERVRLPIENWLIRGVLREDDITPTGYVLAHEACGEPEEDPYGPITRVLNHFYDPINNRALQPYGITCSSIPLLGVSCSKSVDWALGYVDSFATSPQIDTSRRNHFTYVDARENMWLALTAERGRTMSPYTASARAADAQERFYRWSTTFRALGDVIHLLEDGAQPQHVRNDPHSPFLSSTEQQAYEPYTNARVLGGTASSASSYVRSFFGGTGKANDPKLPPIVIGTYAPPGFTTPLRFFTTRLQGDGPLASPSDRYGLIDYTNRSFFTGGSRPEASTGANFLVPPIPVADGVNGYTAIKQPCVLSKELVGHISNLECTHLMHATPDSIAPNYVDQLPPGFSAPPLLAEGTYKWIGINSRIPRSGVFYAIGPEEFQTMGNLAIPRAIGYSAGLINYFFRGQLSITPPPVGLYAVLDHGKPHSVNGQGYPCVGNSPSDGCTIFGFTQVQMNIQNTTPDIVESGSGTTVVQRMTNGKLVAVTRYHRDTCYQRDLSGAIGYDINSRTVVYPSNCPDINAVTGARTAYPEIAVSAEIPIDANGMMTVNGQSLNINSNSALLVRFDFSSDPIPVNATDVFLQVVFRGNLGNEWDGIAVGNIDVSEPSYVTALNMTDYMIYKNQWLTPAEAKALDPILDANPFNVSIQTCIDDHLIAQHGDASGPMVGLPPAQSVRYAALLDPNSTAHRMSTTYSSSLTNRIVHYRSSPIAPHFAQAGMEQNPADGDEVYTMLVLYRARNVNLGDSYDYATVGYQPNYTNLPKFPAAALPLDNEGFYRPIAADNLYLNNPAPQICNQQ